MKEVEEQATFSTANFDISELTAFTTYFNEGSTPRYQAGLTHKSEVFEKWHTDYEKNSFDKEVHQRDETLEKRGHRDGRNEHGETWHEEWL